MKTMKLAVLTVTFCVFEIAVLGYLLPYLLLCQGGGPAC